MGVPRNLTREEKNQKQLESYHRLKNDPRPKLEPTHLCNARSRYPDRQADYCKNPAGFGTDHVGEGRCKFHGGSSPVRTSGRYSKYAKTRLSDVVAEFMQEDDPYDTLPEICMLRALFVDFINRYDAFSDALFDWHESYKKGDLTAKPTQVIDFMEAYKLLDAVTKAVERVKKQQNANAISRRDMVRIMSEMGRVIQTYVTDDELLAKIREGWLGIKF